MALGTLLEGDLIGTVEPCHEVFTMFSTSLEDMIGTRSRSFRYRFKARPLNVVAHMHYVSLKPC